MRAALFALLAAAVAFAWIVTRRRPEHRPLALALSAALVADICRAGIVAWILPPPSPTPLEGLLRIAVAFERALFIAWPFALAAAAVRVLAKRRAWPLAIAYVIAVLVLVLGYPALRFEALRKAYLAIDLIAAAPAVAAVAVWYAEGWRRRRAGAKEPPDLLRRAAAVLVAGHFATIVAGPYQVGLFGEAWNLARVGYAVTLGAVILLQLGEVMSNAEP